MIEIVRDIKLDIIDGKYKAISAYKIPTDPSTWLDCPNCGLKPLVWEFNKNWNYWVTTGIEVDIREKLLAENKW
jgi:hypothetical protein